jgi:hypothetical protein
MEKTNEAVTESAPNSAADAGATESAVTEVKEVDITKLSNEELEKLEKEVLSTGASEQPEEATKAEEAASDNQEPEVAVEPQEDAPEAQEEPRVEPKKPDLDEVMRRIEGIELVFQRQASRVGDQKRQLTELIDLLKQKTPQLWDESPAQAAEATFQMKQAEQQLAALESEEENASTTLENLNVLKHKNVFSEANPEEIAAVFEREGANPEWIQAFRANPFAVPAAVTIHAAKQAKAERVAIGLYRLIQEKDRQIADLKKKPNQVLNKVQQAARSISGITGKAERPQVSSNLLSKDPTKMSKAELDEAWTLVSRK